jgi:glycine cleavage system aminomethyltransferase T
MEQGSANKIMKRSALFHSCRLSGASFIEHHGWTLPAFFQAPEAEAGAARAGVGIADISYRVKFEGRTRPERNGWLLGARHYLTIGDPPLDSPPGATDVSSVYANLLLAGPRSQDVLSKLTSLRLAVDAFPSGTCAQANVAHAHAIVLREDLPDLTAYHLLISREFAESVWESILHAGHEYHLRPFGLQALELLKA